MIPIGGPTETADRNRVMAMREQQMSDAPVVGAETPIQTFYEGPLFDPFGLRAGLQPIAGTPPHGLAPAETDLRHLALAGTRHRLYVRPSGSFFGDCIHVVDAPEEQPLAAGFPAFGWSGDELLGGAAMTASRLGGEIELCFADAIDGRLPFSLACSQPLVGGDGVLSAPDCYELPVRGNQVALIGPTSRGLLDPSTGRVYDFHLNCEFRNSAIDALLAQNPGLESPPLLFPGVPHGGHALAWVTVSDESELELHVAAQLFLPLGAGTPEAPLTMPASPGSPLHDAPFPARNSALHPFIFLACAERSADRAGGRRARSATPSNRAASSTLRAHENETVSLLCWPEENCFGDDFDLVTDDLGGGALAQSPLFGELEIQIGRIVDGCAVFSLRFSPPSAAYKPKFDSLLQLLPPGTSPGLLGMRGDLAFPNHVYDQRNLSLNSDPYKPSVGVAEVATGKVRAVLRKYLFQDLMMNLLLNEPRTPSDSFSYVAEGAFGDADGALTFRLDGSLFIPYPGGYRFPLPDGGTTTAQEGSRLLPFVRLDAIEQRAFGPLPAEPAFGFVGRRHVRGRPAEEVSLDLTPVGDSGRRRFTLRAGDIVVEGHADVGRQATHRGRRLTTGRLDIPGDDGCVCNYYLTVAGAEAQLQIVSSTEEWDLWYRGAVEPAG